MKYTIKGNLCGFLCEDCTEFIYDAEVLLYLPWQQDRVTDAAAANTKETFRQVSSREMKERSNLLIARAKTDAKGNFEFSVDEKHAGTAFDIDFICGTVPRVIPKPPRKEPVQFHLTTFMPKWRVEQERESSFFSWNYCIPSKWWCYIRGVFFDAWVICGHLRNCDTGIPIENAIVTAWDADFITDDNLGSATTDASGHFRIEYTSVEFKKTFLSPIINLETDPGTLTFHSGPDVYFKAHIGSVTLIDETSANRRNNVSYCLCVDLCTKINVTHPGETIPSAWTGIGRAFNVITGVGPKDFDVDGYAGSGKNVLSGAIRLTGQAASKSSSGNPVEYRFLVSDVTTPNGGPAPALANFTKIVGVTPNLFVPSIVAQLVENSFPFAPYDVVSAQADFDADGWFDINSAIARCVVDNSLGSLSNYALVDEDTLITLNTTALTTAPNVPANIVNAGTPVPVANEIPIEKVAIRFEIREVVNKPANIFNTITGSGKTLNSAIINNNPIYMMLALEAPTLCAPLHNDVHAKYTVYHPHLADAYMHLFNNSHTIDCYVTDGFLTLAGNTNPLITSHANSALLLNPANDFTRCSYLLEFNPRARLHDGDNGAGYSGPLQQVFFYDI